VASRVGAGTTMSVRLPAHAGIVTAARNEPARGSVPA
jgi:hypothetical protein